MFHTSTTRICSQRKYSLLLQIAMTRCHRRLWSNNMQHVDWKLFIAHFLKFSDVIHTDRLSCDPPSCTEKPSGNIFRRVWTLQASVTVDIQSNVVGTTIERH